MHVSGRGAEQGYEFCPLSPSQSLKMGVGLEERAGQSGTKVQAEWGLTPFPLRQLMQAR